MRTHAGRPWWDKLPPAGTRQGPQGPTCKTSARQYRTPPHPACPNPILLQLNGIGASCDGVLSLSWCGCSGREGVGQSCRHVQQLPASAGWRRTSRAECKRHRRIRWHTTRAPATDHEAQRRVADTRRRPFPPTCRTIVAMQIVLLLGTAVCAATQRIHSFRSAGWAACLRRLKI